MDIKPVIVSSDTQMIFRIQRFVLMKWLCFLATASTTCGMALGQLALEQAATLPGTEVLSKHKIMEITTGPLGFVWIATDQNLFR